MVFNSKVNCQQILFQNLNLVVMKIFDFYKGIRSIIYDDLTKFHYHSLQKIMNGKRITGKLNHNYI